MNFSIILLVLTGSVICADLTRRSLTYEDILRDTATQGTNDFDLSSDAVSTAVQGQASDNLSERSLNFSGTASSKYSQPFMIESIQFADELQQLENKVDKLTRTVGSFAITIHNMNTKKKHHKPVAKFGTLKKCGRKAKLRKKDKTNDAKIDLPKLHEPEKVHPKSSSSFSLSALHQKSPPPTFSNLNKCSVWNKRIFVSLLIILTYAVLVYKSSANSWLFLLNDPFKVINETYKGFKSCMGLSRTCITEFYTSSSLNSN